MAVALSAATLLLPSTTTTNKNLTCVITTSSHKANVVSFVPSRSCFSGGVSFSRRGSDVVAFSALSGTPGIESSSDDVDTASLLDTVKVFDLNGNGIPISDLWKDRTAVIAFARHFGCVFCRKRADYLASKKVPCCCLHKI